MNWEVTPYISALLLGPIIPLVGALFLLRFRNIYGYKFGVTFFAGCFIWILCYYFELLSLAEQTKILWAKMKYLGIAILPIAFFMLVLYYSGYSKWITVKKISLFSIIPSVTIAIAFTNQFHGLMWRSIDIKEGIIISSLEKDYGIWFWVWTVFAYSLFLASYVLLSKLLFGRQKVFRNHAVVMIATMSIPLIFNLTDIFNIYSLPNLDNTPLALALGSAVLLYGFTRQKVGDFIPISIEPDIEKNKDMVIAIDKKKRIVHANRKAMDCLGENNLIGRDIDSVLGCSIDFGGSRFEIINDLKLDKLPNIFSLTINPFLDMEKKMLGKVLIFTDVTEQKMAEKRYRSIFENSLDGIFRMDMDGNYIQANKSMLKIFGCDNKSELPVIDIDEDFKSLKWLKKTFEAELPKKDGSKIWVEISLWSVMERNNKIFFEGIARDASIRKKSEEKIRYLSFHDSLTNLYNRHFFEEELKRLDSKRLLPISVIIGDVNGLKLVNDTFGHKKGDQLLCSISRILKACFRKEDILARWGGDEFIAILPNTPYKDAVNVVERIKERCFYESCKELTLSISLGCATKKEECQDLNDLIKEAEDRMYRHKLMENKSTRSRIISSLEKTLEERDYETEEHMKRMKILAKDMGTKLNLPESELDELNLLATLHDIGKIALADHIILKPGKLTRDEWKTIRKHPEIGYRIASQSPELSAIADPILYHHERWDGRGYPRGLKGEKIPFTSRIIAVIDAFDAMTNNRPYRKAISRQEAMSEILKCSGTQFDPQVVSVFANMMGMVQEERKPPSTGSSAPCT
ncbi:MAG: histidine kinase N-terminal 7TM domain-containing protein [Actinomycetota bacterium]